MNQMDVWYAAPLVFAAFMAMILISRAAFRSLRRARDSLREKEGWLMKAQYVRNIADARLSAIRRTALVAMGPGHMHPYRRNAERLAEALREIVEIVHHAMTENCREVGHFRTLPDAMRFISQLPPGRNPYVFPLQLWDGDCYHVIYSTKEGEPVWTQKHCDGCVHDERRSDDPEAIPCPVFSFDRPCPHYLWDDMNGPEPTEIPPEGMLVRR